MVGTKIRTVVVSGGLKARFDWERGIRELSGAMIKFNVLLKVVGNIDACIFQNSECTFKLCTFHCMSILYQRNCKQIPNSN